MTNITAGKESLGIKPRNVWYDNSHLDPTGTLQQRRVWAILITDVSIGITLAGLWYAATKVEFFEVLLPYRVQYILVNHRIGKSISSSC